jgi:hypothetical protein
MSTARKSVWVGCQEVDCTRLSCGIFMVWMGVRYVEGCSQTYLFDRKTLVAFMTRDCILRCFYHIR